MYHVCMKYTWYLPKHYWAVTLHCIVRYMTSTAYITMDMLLSISVLEFHLKLVVYFSTKGNIFTVNQYHICSARNKNQKLVGRFLKIGYLVGYWLLSHWKCTGNLADQNGFCLTKCWNWSENGRWPTVISSTDVLASHYMVIVDWVTWIIQVKFGSLFAGHMGVQVKHITL